MAVERYYHFDGQLVTVMFFCHEMGDYIPTHAHLSDHTITVPVGAFDVCENGTTETYIAPALGTIARHAQHSLVALKAGSIAICSLIPRAEDGRPLTSEEMDGMTAIDLWRAQERV